MEAFADLQPSALWAHFARLCALPRGAGQESAAIDAIDAWAQDRGFSTERDPAGNLLVTTPGTKGAPIALQAHVDMVCVPEQSFPLPIPVVKRDDWLHASSSTLGADNGIGVAIAMAAAETLGHDHPLDLLFTVGEEVGLIGAMNCTITGLRAKRLINLDAEEPGSVTVACAGGGEESLTLTLDRMPPHRAPGGDLTLQLSVSGLQGGHSGLDIARSGANAIQILAQALWRLRDHVAYGLASVRGGSADNVIPNEAEAVLVFGAADDRDFAAALEQIKAQVAQRYGALEPNIQWCVESTATPSTIMRTQCRDRLLNLILATPHGPQARFPQQPTDIATSANLAIVRTEGDLATVLISSRAASTQALFDLRERVRALAVLAGPNASFRSTDPYPGWDGAWDAPLVNAAIAAWNEAGYPEATRQRIHAGLECGALSARFPDVEMISVGPRILGAHTTSEKVSITSVQEFWRFLLSLLATLRTG